MGMYTSFSLEISLAAATIKEVEEMMPSLLDSRIPFPDSQEHPFFKCPRAPGFLNRSDGRSQPFSKLAEIYPGEFRLVVNTCLKNYDDEIEQFLNWLLPYVEDDPGPKGTYRYEEDNLYSTIVYTGSSFELDWY